MSNNVMKKCFTSLISLSLLIGAAEVHAESLFIKSDGNKQKSEVARQFEEFETQSKSSNQYEAAIASFKLAEMLIEGYHDDAYCNGRSALEHYEQVAELLKVLPKDERYCSRGVSAAVLRELIQTKIAVTSRLTDFYLHRELGTGSVHVSPHKDVKKVKALWEAILGEQVHWFTREDHALAYFQLAQLTAPGSKKYFKYLERAAALNNTDAIAALADYSQEKADKLRAASQQDNCKEAFISYTRSLNSENERVTKVYLLNDNPEDFINYARTALITEEIEHSAERVAASNVHFELAYKAVHRDDFVPEKVDPAKEVTKLKLLSHAFDTLDLKSLAGIYQEDALKTYLRAALLGDTEVCKRIGKKYLSSASDLPPVIKRDHDDVAISFFHIGAKNNDGECWFNLGRMFEEGRGSPPDKEKAIDCYLISHKRHEYYYAGTALKRLGVSSEEREPKELVKFWGVPVIISRLCADAQDELGAVVPRVGPRTSTTEEDRAGL